MVRMEQMVGVQGKDSGEQGLAPGFRFHPTDEELLSFYLASKVFESSYSYCGVAIAEVNLNKCEPWDLPEIAKLGEREWYLFNLRDRKYPTSLRTNRATGSGYWKATGKDKKVFSASRGGGLLGMKKTLVFYKGRAPHGEKSSWVMHEYQLATTFPHRLRPLSNSKGEWVMCRVFHKTGEKKNQPFQEKSRLLRVASSSTTMPTMADCQTQAFQYPLQIHCQERNPKSLTRSQSQVFPQSPSIFIDTLLSRQDPTIPVQWNTQAIDFPRFPQPHSNSRLCPVYYQHPSHFQVNRDEIDYPLAADAGVPDESTSIIF